MSFFLSNIRHLLKKREYTPASFSSVLHKTPAAIKRLLSGKLLPAPDDLVAIADTFRIRVDDLLRKDLAGRTRLLKNKHIRFLAVDVDCVLTDGGMYYTESGDEYKKFHTRDGVALRRLSRLGFPVGMISSGLNINLIRRRAELLGVQYVHAGKEPKRQILEEWCRTMKIEPGQVAYVGDDRNDMAVMEICGLTACPSDAVDEIKDIAHILLTRKGGEGCIREFLDEYLGPVLWPERNIYSIDLKIQRKILKKNIPGKILRNPVPQDSELLAGLFLDAYQGTIDYRGETIVEARKEVKDYFENTNKELLRASWIMQESGNLVGASLVGKWEQKPAPLIWYVMIARKDKQRGYGRAILQHSLLSLREGKFRKIYAVITSGNRPSEKLFQKTGFRPE